MKKLNSHLLITAAVLALAAVIIPTSVRADDRSDRDSRQFEVVSFVEHFSSFDGTNGTLDGDVVLAGKFNDRGTRHEQFTVVGANNDGSEVYIIGSGVITAAKGTITMRFTGTIHFTSADIAYVEGPESVTGGTGAYANARGRGSFIATQDSANPVNQLVGTVELKWGDRRGESGDSASN